MIASILMDTKPKPLYMTNSETKGSTINMKDLNGIDHEIHLREAGTSLYGGSPLNHLITALTLLLCCTTFVVPNNFVDELLKLLKETILLKDNTLSKSFYEPKCMYMKLGMCVKVDGVCLGKICRMQRSAQDVIIQGFETFSFDSSFAKDVQLHMTARSGMEARKTRTR